MNTKINNSFMNNLTKNIKINPLLTTPQKLKESLLTKLDLINKTSGAKQENNINNNFPAINRNAYYLASNINIRQRQIDFSKPLLEKNITKSRSAFIRTDEPFILTNKKPNLKIKSLSYINNDTGLVKYFTPAAQEWHNSVYSYNGNYIKLLPSADKNLIFLLKNYFNSFLSSKLFKGKTLSIGRKFLRQSSRKLSANKVFLANGDIKHNNDKVIITSYVYNVEKLYLKNIIKKFIKMLYLPKEELKIISYSIPNNAKNGKNLKIFNRPYTLEEYLNLPQHLEWHRNICFSLFWKQYKKIIGINKLKEKNLLNNTKTFKDSTRKIFLDAFSHNISLFKENISFINLFNPLLESEDENKILKFKNKIIKYKKFYDDYDHYKVLASNNYRKIFLKYIYLLMINNAKFEIPFLFKFSQLVKKIYNKKIEFNFVNLNKFYLNSDIFTEIVTLKLRNRKNNLSNVLALSMNNIKLSKNNRRTLISNISNRNEYLTNKIRNKYINTMFFTSSVLGKTQENNYIDSLDNLLSRLFFFHKNEIINVLASNTSLASPAKQDKAKPEEKDNSSNVITKDSVLSKYVLKSLKNNKIAGLRLEVKGRLTRRFTASRSLYKVKLKGGLKNIDSSFKGLSTVMLRGYRKSNVQYTMLNSKSRNGAFGIRGWVSSK